MIDDVRTVLYRLARSTAIHSSTTRPGTQPDWLRSSRSAFRFVARSNTWRVSDGLKDPSCTIQVTVPALAAGVA